MKGNFKPFAGSRAAQVCDLCFDGDRQAMLSYAERFLADPRWGRLNPLGIAFRRAVGTRPRQMFWRRAAAAIRREGFDPKQWLPPPVRAPWTNVKRKRPGPKMTRESILTTLKRALSRLLEIENTQMAWVDVRDAWNEASRERW